MRKLRRLLVWVLACATPFVIPACSDDDPINEKPSENPSEVIAETSGLEWYGYSLPFEIKSDKAWKIEFDEAGEEIACASPAQGTGNTTVTLYVLDNLEAAPRTGTMTVSFPAASFNVPPASSWRPPNVAVSDAAHAAFPVPTSMTPAYGA